MKRRATKKRKGNYTKTFKNKVVNLVLNEEGTIYGIAKEMAMPRSTLGGWVRLARKVKSGKNEVPQKQPSSPAKTDELTAVKEELARLKADNKQLKQTMAETRTTSLPESADNSITSLQSGDAAMFDRGGKLLLSSLEDKQLALRPERQALLVASVHLLAGNQEVARTFARLALDLGCPRSFVAKILIAGVHNTIGRAAAIADKPEKSVKHLTLGMRMGLHSDPGQFMDLLMNEAERCSRRGQGREAVQRWQDIACILGEKTPDYVYKKLSQAYADNKQGFGGTDAENHVWGDCHKHDILEFLHEQLKPALYLEIGVDGGHGLARAKGRAIGVDARPDLDIKLTLPEKASIITASSDTFFRDQAATWLNPRPELVFIDGMHLFEFALRDFINVERFSAPNTLVVIDDIYPCHPAQTLRRRRSNSWTGDIWKLYQILRENRPDLTMLALNANTTGLLLICGLDPNNRILQENYDRIVEQFFELDTPPENVLERHGAIPSDHQLVGQLIDILERWKEDGGTAAEQLREELATLKPMIVEAAAGFLGRAKGLVGECDLSRIKTTGGQKDVDLNTSEPNGVVPAAPPPLCS